MNTDGGAKVKESFTIWKIWGRNLASASGEEETSIKECEELMAAEKKEIDTLSLIPLKPRLKGLVSRKSQ